MSGKVLEAFSTQNIGSRVQRLRGRQYTQKDVAAALGRSGSRISFLETADWRSGQLSLGEIQRLAAFFKVHPLELFAGLSKEACELVDRFASMTPAQREVAVRLCSSAISTAELMAAWHHAAGKRPGGPTNA